MNVSFTVPPAPGGSHRRRDGDHAERPRPDESRILPLALTLALGLHAVLAFATPEHSAPHAVSAPPLEVDLAPPSSPPPAPLVPPPSPAENRPPPAPTAKPIAHALPPPAVSPRAAGQLLAASAPATDDEPLDFVTDQNGGSYGFGVVTRGGAMTGEGKAAPVAARAVAAALPALPRSDLVGASDLSEKPRLAVPGPCRGYYPASALVDSASATVRVVIEPDGRVRQADVVSEDPKSQGFGTAARQCIAAQRFTSARDRLGHAVPTATTVRVHFAR